MTQERITETTDSQGNTHTTRVISDGRTESGGGKWVFLIILLIAVGAGIYFFTQTSASEMAKDNAIGEAASQVGEAANQVGEAAQDAADTLQGE